MNKLFPNDQRSIAEECIFIDTHNCQVANLAYRKIATLKLSYYHAAFNNSQYELYELVKRSLLNYISPDKVLCREGFFENEIEN